MTAHLGALLGSPLEHRDKFIESYANTSQRVGSLNSCEALSLANITMCGSLVSFEARVSEMDSRGGVVGRRGG